MSRAASNSLDTQDHDGTGEEDFDEAADDAAAEEGDAELAGEEGDPEADEGDESEEEQSEEDQEEPEEELEGEAEEEEPAGFRFKDEKSGNFDWQKMNKVLGGDDLEKSFKESQATITRFAQENKELKENHLPQLQRRANVAQYFEQLVQANPAVREAVLRDLNGQGQAGQGGQGQGHQDPFAGFNPNDPALPILRQMHQQNLELQNWQRQQAQQAQTQQRENTFLQGLKGARERFKELTGKEPSEEQLRLVAGEMQRANFLNGSALVPNLFVKEIQDAATAKLLSERKTKKNLPRSTKSTRRTPGTQKKVSKRGAFEEEWDKHMGGDE
jgi:hypothetical protein